MNSSQQSEMSTVQNQQLSNDEIDLVQIAKIIWRGKWIVCIFTIIFAIGSVYYAKSLPNIYRSEALV